MYPMIPHIALEPCSYDRAVTRLSRDSVSRL